DGVTRQCGVDDKSHPIAPPPNSQACANTSDWPEALILTQAHSLVASQRPGEIAQTQLPLEAHLTRLYWRRHRWDTQLSRRLEEGVATSVAGPDGGLELSSAAPSAIITPRWFRKQPESCERLMNEFEFGTRVVVRDSHGGAV